MNLFILSDIHGMSQHFDLMLKRWDEKSRLVLLGDLVDRGPDSYKVLKKCVELKKYYGNLVVYVKGNHDEAFLDYLEHPYATYRYYYDLGGKETIRSFLPLMNASAVEENAAKIKEKFPEEIKFLQGGLDYYVEKKVLCTHAGFDTSLKNWKDAYTDDFLWIHDHYRHPNKTGLCNVFGHTPTRYIQHNDDVWLSQDKLYIGIDGACAYGGQLNAVFMTDKGEILETYKLIANVHLLDAQSRMRQALDYKNIVRNLKFRLITTDDALQHCLKLERDRYKHLMKGSEATQEEYKRLFTTFQDELYEKERQALKESLR